MKKRWDILVFCVLFTAIGIAGGWLAARQSGGSDAPGDSGESSAVDSSDHALSQATLNNLGVTIGEAKVGSFTKYRSVPTVVERTKFNAQPVYAPFAGRVAEVRAEIGMVVKPKDVLVTIVRDPIPRPTLTLTEAILKPAQESIHATVVELRMSREEERIVQTELERVEKYTSKVGEKEVPILPRQRAIDLKYQLLRAKKAAEQAQLELSKHGLTEEQIDSIAKGGSIPNLTEDSWKRALTRNGLWPASAEALYGVLAEKQRSLPWIIATIGELSASGLNKPELIEWMKTVPDDCEHFLEIGSLLQRGHSVADIRRLHDLDAFSSVIEVKAPAGPEDWNVDETMVRPGARVEAGTPLMTLLNPRVMYLKAVPVGGEKTDVLRAMKEKAHCTAKPLVKDSGPELPDVRLTFATGRPDEIGGTVAFAEVENQPLAETIGQGGRKNRTWQLRSGLKYMLRVPTTRMENVFVIPSGAVAVEGPNKVVFVQDGESFRSVPVEILYRDDEVAVLPVGKDTALFPGDPLVMSGAFALGIALKADTAKPDAHAGHQH